MSGNIQNDNPEKVNTTQWKPSRHQMIIIVTLSIMSFVIALDATVIVTSLSSIIQDIGGNSTQAFWVGTAYLISCAVVMPFLASLSGIFGRPAILTGSLILFTTGTILCCVANSIALLLGGRVVSQVTHFWATPTSGPPQNDTITTTTTLFN
ncbi:major facilitator superfamily domain-containing protein [Colletotrichum cereale]|nr:major facilitator superfamily domain-containing protein [Colletotrichum cereale]